MTAAQLNRIQAPAGGWRKEDLDEVYWQVKEMLPSHPQVRTSNVHAFKKRESPVKVLRRGFTVFLLIEFAGLSCLALGLAVSAFAMGLGLAAMFGGFAVIILHVHGYGLVTGHHLLNPRYATSGILAFAGLAITALAAAIQHAG